METGDAAEFGGDGGVAVQRALEAGRELAAVSGREIGAGVVSRAGGESGATGKIGLPAADSVLLNGVVEKRQRVAVEEQAEAGAEDPGRVVRGPPGQAQARGQVAAGGRNARGHPLPVVAQAGFDGQARRGLPAILNPEAQRQRGLARAGLAIGADEQVGLSRTPGRPAWETPTRRRTYWPGARPGGRNARWRRRSTGAVRR